MKKKYFYCFFIMLSLFLFINSASSATMYMKCGDYSFYTITPGSELTSDLDRKKIDGNTVRIIDNTSSDNNNTITFGVLSGNWATDSSNIDSKDKQDYEIYEDVDAVAEKLKSGVCPESVSLKKDKYNLGGIGSSPKSKSEITSPEYVIYSYKPTNFDYPVVIAEAYNTSGTYAFINHKLENEKSVTMRGSTLYVPYSAGEYQIKLMEKRSEASIMNNSFWKISNTFTTHYPYVMGVCSDRNTCFGDPYYYKIILSSDETLQTDLKLEDIVRDWTDNEMINQSNLNNINSLKNSELIDTAKNIDNSAKNNTKYNFTNEYTATTMVDDLTTTLEELKNFYPGNFIDYSGCDEDGTTESSTASVMSYFWNEIGKKAFENTGTDINFTNYCSASIPVDLAPLSHSENIVELEKIIKNAVENKITEINSSDGINLLNFEEQINEYIRSFTTSIIYIDNNFDQLVSSGMLDSSYKETIESLRGSYEKFANEKGIAVVMDCKGLLGQELVDKINSYLNIIKIAIPLILILLGTIDFCKAVFASDENAIDSAKKDFIKRLAIAILIFIAPSIINLLLQLANKVWPIIEPSTCGLWE